MMPLTKIYLPGLKLDTSTISVPLTSSSILFVAQYCGPQNLELIFISDGFIINLDKTVELDIELLNGFRYKFTDESIEAEDCMLPVVRVEDSSLVRSGLCCTIRHIVSITDKQWPDEQFSELLGFRAGSLKACAEVSGWTKLCEVELPQSITDLIYQIKHLKSDTLKGDNLGFQINLPEDLMKLEWHFKKPPKIHNDDKMKRALASNFHKEADCFNKDTDISNFKFERNVQYPHHVMKYRVKTSYSNSKSNLTGDNEKKKNQDLNSNSNKSVNSDLSKTIDNSKSKMVDHLCDNHHSTDTDLCKKCVLNAEQFGSVVELSDFLKKLTLFDIDLVHQYSEGISITVADLILFTYIYHLMENISFDKSCIGANLPNIVTWFDHMCSLPRIQQTCRKCKFKVDWFISDTPADVIDKLTNNKESVNFTVPDNLEEQINDDEMELSRRCRAKYRAIKPDVALALDKIKAGEIEVEVGRHPKGDNVELEWTSYPADVNPGTDLPNKRVKRKCQQLENLVTAVMGISKPGDKIVDYCSGGGHLGIVIAYLLPECKVYLVENKEESLKRAKTRIEKLKLTNVTLFQCNMDYFKGKFDIGVCLHACGVATDMVLQQCLDNNAAFVICPCCYGGVQNTHLITYPRSKVFQSADIATKDYITLGHAADQTELNTALEEQGKYCMNLVDTDRANQARERGYTVTLCALKPLLCTPKNNLLIGVPPTLT